jgi:hypothetical protein
MSQKRFSTCMNKASVQKHTKSMSLEGNSNAAGRTEAGEDGSVFDCTMHFEKCSQN